ncbi:MAG: hypothetical protein MUE39_08385 [Gammaproteobacteria bacterium]|nr:hypothetical protein [Gammaproteobacteria bacterium]
MRIKLTDKAGDALQFDWDPATGEISGPDGWWIDRVLALWDGVAGLARAEQLAPNPRYSTEAMALFLLAQGFLPPDELRAPPARDDPPRHDTAP